MKLLTFRHGDHISYGFLRGKDVIDLGRRCPEPDLQAFIAAGGWRRPDLPGLDADHALVQLSLLPPILHPTHIIAVGLNTKSHFEETREVMARKPDDPYPKYPRLFLRSALSHAGHLQDILIPKVSSQLDYEGEIALVIGRECRYVSEQDALDVVAGVSCYNDGSIRDYQKHSQQVTAGKNFFRSGGFGPWITTVDEIGDLSTLTMTTAVNGTVRQRLSLDDLIFDFRQLISYTSQIFALQPGDVIVTGSPAGIGALGKNWLRAGDRVDVEVTGVGTLTNYVKSEP